MKLLYSLLCFICVATISAQKSPQEKMEFEQMLHSEKKRGRSMLDFNVNPNTNNYDLRYHRLELELDPNVYNITGKVTSKFIPNQNISSIYFDLNNQLNVSSVSYHGQNVTFQQLAEEIKINFPTQISNGTLDSLTINYSGAPSSANSAFTKGSSGGNPVIYTLSEPYGAKDWWPCKQSLNDKVEKVDIKVTSPAAYSVASNGKLLSESLLPNGKKLTHWQTNYPIPAYLVALGVTNYVKTTTQIGPVDNTFPFVNYVYPATANNSASQANIAWTNVAMNLFEENFGAYPYRNEKYGHMQFGFGGGMEHATMSSMGSWSKSLIAHELAHQWFGDKITCKTWNDIWINEGFATYGEFLIYEKVFYPNDITQLNAYFQDNIDYICSSPEGSLYVADADLNDIGTVFSYRLSYLKGGHTLRMLRWILGEAAYTAAIKNYTSNPNLAYNYASTTDFKNSLLASTGRDFTEFFNDWVYGQGYPTYTIRWNQNPATNTGISLKISQSQSHNSVSYFEMPLPIRVHGTAGQVLDLVIQNDTNNQQAFANVPFTIANVEFDPNFFIISKDNQVIKDATLSSEESKLETIKIYPNPVKDVIEISGLRNAAPFEIFNLEGRLIEKNSYQPNQKINVEKLEKGVYILKIQSQNFKFIKK